MKKVFIDGTGGIVGSRLLAKLKGRRDIELITIENTKDTQEKKAALNRADIVFICLPETQGKDAIAMIDNPQTVVIDLSGAGRNQPGWMYGFPELYAGYEKQLKQSKRIVMPNPHAVGFITLIRPLIDARLISAGTALSCCSVIGHSVGGKQMVEQYNHASYVLQVPRQYALAQNHKGLAEMTGMSGLKKTPIFSPLIAPHYNGVTLSIFLFAEQMDGGRATDIKSVYAKHYPGPVIKLNEEVETDTFFSSSALVNRDSMEVSVTGNAERIILSARYDNLGKGSAGAAVECMNILLGVPKAKGLEL